MNDSDHALEALKFKIRTERGFNSHVYKDKCLRRRLDVRMRARGCEDFAQYAALLDRDTTEYDRLIDTLTINITKFFRNAPTWERIASDVIPSLFEVERPEVRIWSAGCASGEEPYSLAILLHEWAARNDRLADLQGFTILGTDIDRRSLQVAVEAVYPELSLEETSAERRERWFSSGPPYRLHQAIRNSVEFRRSDVISDPPPRQQSLILCRNVLIYFDREAQERLFQLFYDALLPGGYLVLGRVETLLGRTRPLLRPVSTRDRIYQKPA